MSANDNLRCELLKSCPSFTAGFNVLDKFLNRWEQLHSRSEKNVAKANKVSNTLASIERSSARQMEALNEFISSYKSLSKLNDQIKTIDGHLNLLFNSLSNIEELLIVLKNDKEVKETNQYMEDLSLNYQQQVQQLQANSKENQERLKLEHLQRVTKFEIEQQSQLEERRRILEKAFEEEKKNYLAKTKEQ